VKPVPIKTISFWVLVYALALPAGWAARVMLAEPLGNLAWVGVVYFLAWLPLRLVKPGLVYFSLLANSFGPVSGFEALFVGLQANLGNVALLLALLPLLVVGILLISVSIFLIPTLVLFLFRLVRSSTAERRSDFHQAQDWVNTRGAQLLKGYGVYLVGAAIGMGIGLLFRSLFGLALDEAALISTALLAQSLLARSLAGSLLGLVIFWSTEVLNTGGGEAQA
jgi:hypothetical protein